MLANLCVDCDAQYCTCKHYAVLIARGRVANVLARSTALLLRVHFISLRYSTVRSSLTAPWITILVLLALGVYVGVSIHKNCKCTILSVGVDTVCQGQDVIFVCTRYAVQLKWPNVVYVCTGCSQRCCMSSYFDVPKFDAITRQWHQQLTSAIIVCGKR